MLTNRRRPPRSHRRAFIVAISTLTLAAIPAAAPAQTYWRIPSALTGAFAGAGVGWIVDLAMWGGGGGGGGGPQLIGTSAGIALGGLVGFVSGHAADRRLARGDTLSRGTRVALRTATFLAPVAAGSAIAFAMINPSDECVPYTGPEPGIICTPPDKMASDETVLLLAIGGGAMIGFVAQHKFARALWPRARVGIAPDGRGVMVSVPLGW